MLKTSFAGTLRFLLMAFAFLAFYSSPGYALDIDKVPEMPEVPEMSDEEFGKLTRKLKQIPENDESLAFSIYIPKGWKVLEDVGLRNFMLSRKVVGEIARYYGPPLLDRRSSISISAMEMEHQITAKNWFIHHIFTKGYTLEGMEVLDENKVKAQYVLMEDDIPYSVRAIAQTNGKRIILVQYYVPFGYKNEYAALQARVIDTFKLLNPSREYVEATDTYEFLDLVEFDYPLSWELRTPRIKDILRMRAFLVKIYGDDQFYGKISIYVLSGEETKIPEEIKRVKNKAMEQNFKIGSFIEEIENYEFLPHVKSSAIEVYEFNSTKHRLVNYEYWFGIILSRGDYYYIVTMITPSRDDDFINWAHNKEVFEFVATSVRPGAAFY
jgi:hypothetical protein